MYNTLNVLLRDVNSIQGESFMKRTAAKLTAIILASMLLIALIPAAASAAIAGPSAPTFTTVMRHTPRTLFPVPGSAVLVVTDAETGLPVAGAKYDLYRVAEFAGKDTKVTTLTTGKDGKIVVSHATTGKFYWAVVLNDQKSYLYEINPTLGSVAATQLMQVPDNSWLVNMTVVEPQSQGVTGDVNLDGDVTTIDITCIYNYLLNGDETYLETSDVDGDGNITTTDITVIYNILLGQ